ncbi:uncharacterized protein LOC143280247 [Babylonia areolata]|uniref:uncharacterized protein LOC143280247 n=1 Tax=Babylonia areolata TaxID=304850 RepID=UPI003FD3C506
MFKPSFPKKVSSRNAASLSPRRSHRYSKKEVQDTFGGLIIQGRGFSSSNQSNCSVHPAHCQTLPLPPWSLPSRIPPPKGTSGHFLNSYPGSTITGSACCRRRRDLRDDEEDRRGGISYDRADKNAIYVRALGDGRMRGKADLGGDRKVLEWERKLLDQLTGPDHKLRFRSRFLSMHRVHRRRKPRTKLTRENRTSVDDNYFVPSEVLLSTVGSWDFNVFLLDSLTGGRSLLYLAYRIFREYNFIQRFRLDIIRLLRFFSSVEDSYHDSNPYHNIIHASDVTQAMYCYLQEKKLQQSVTPFEAMIAILSAMAHDLDHPGVNQSFLVATANHLATLYQNTSVLEMHHWRYGVGLMQECGVFSHFTNTQWASAIWQFRSLILATDITRQQEFLIKFRRMIDEKEFDYEFNLTSRHFVLQIALKCADICNPCRNWYLSERWSRQVCEEFFRQGDMERQIGIEVAPVCDRYRQTVAKIQIGFMEVVVRPLFMEWKRFLPTDLSNKMVSNILSNKQQWQLVDQKEAAAKTKKVPARTEESMSSIGDDSSSVSTVLTGDGNRNNTMFCHGDDRQGDLREEEEEEQEEENDEEDGDTIENNINLAFHYQTDLEQMSEVGGHSLSPVSEEEQLIMLAQNTRRRHSMPVVVRKDLAFYMGLRRDSVTRSNLQRRQSLPATPVVRTSLLLNGGVGDSVQKVLSVDGLTAQPKISNLCSSVDTRTDYLSFLSLQNQTRLLQQAGVDPGDDHPHSVPHRPSSSCVELRPKSSVLEEDSECVRAVLSGVGRGGEVCHQKLVGLASSWPSILRAGQKEEQTSVKLWMRSPLATTATDFVGPSPSSSNTSSNTNLSSCLSTAQTEGVPLLSRPH